jgi:1,4-alpha-glucan branching enzyme
MAVPCLDWMVEDAHRLADCRHDHPFAVLGPQPLDDGRWVVRVWMPDAESVELLHGGGDGNGAGALLMETPHHPWVFEASLDHNPGSGYRVRVLRGGITHEAHDPWAFREEWMGELDQLLTTSGARWAPTSRSATASSG